MTWLDFVGEQWVLVSLLAVLVAAFLVVEKRKGGNTVSQLEATRLMNADKAVLVDVREAKDYKAGHIGDAINIPFASLNAKLNMLEKHRSKQIIVVDKMGQHSGSAGKILRDKGFNVVRLQGGVAEWTHQNLPLVKS